LLRAEQTRKSPCAFWADVGIFSSGVERFPNINGENLRVLLFIDADDDRGDGVPAAPARGESHGGGVRQDGGQLGRRARRGRTVRLMVPSDWIAGSLDGATPCQWQDGDVLFRQGDAADCAYLLREGAVEVVVDTPLGTLPIAVLAPPSLVGEIALFCDMPRSASVVARGAVSALRLTRADLIAATHRSPEAARSIIAGLGQRLAGQNASVALLSTAARALGEGRVDSAAVAHLLEEADRNGPLSTLFQQVVLAIEAKRLHEIELDLAARVQRAILPKGIDEARVSLHGAMRPAKEVGGDFYDFFVHGDHAVFMIGDVSGKGVPASLFAVTTRTALRALSLAADGPAVMVGLTNRFLAESNEANLFVTLFVGDLDLASGNLVYCNAGHEAPFVLRAAGGSARLMPGGPAVGMIDDYDYRPHATPLARGDLLLAITDGVTDATDAGNRLFGEERLEALLAARGSLSAGDLIAALMARLAEFGQDAEPFDDITCLALGYHPS
jgi:serine phosphatase RsbU (regulator of sigma subunit)